MLLGGTVTGPYSDPEEWEKLLAATRFKAVTAPFDCRTPREMIAGYMEAAKRRGAVIAEAGVWKNVFDQDPAAAAAALDQMEIPEIVGCIAGDDTIMAAVRTVEETGMLVEKMRRLIGDM